MSGNKRSNVFNQGKPEDPYDERPEDPADIPQRATAAQLATRKIKTAKIRRPTGASPNLTQSANFAPSHPSAFTFGASAPAPSNNSANTFDFGGASAFGGSATNSFPPAQSSAPSNPFANSSFPAFGAGTNSFDFQSDRQRPPIGLNLTAASTTPLAPPQTTSTMNGTSPAPSFGPFGTQPQSNPFGSFGQNDTSSSASGGILGATGGSTPTTMSGTTSFSAHNATSTPASQPFTFAASSSAQNNTTAPPPTNMFSGFGTTIQAPTQDHGFSGFGTTLQAPAQDHGFSGFGTTIQAPAQDHGFSGFGTSAQENATTMETVAPQSNLFSGFGTSTQGIESTTTASPATKRFDFSSTAPQKESATITPPTTNLLEASASTAFAPSSTPIGNKSSALSTTRSLFNFTPIAQTPPAPQQTPGDPNNLSGSLKPADSSISAAETPRPTLFASLGKPNGTAVATPVDSTSRPRIFGASQNKDATSSSTDRTAEATTLKASSAPLSTLWKSLSTPQPANTVDSEKPQAGLPNVAQPKMGMGIFSKTFEPTSLKLGDSVKSRPTFRGDSTAKGKDTVEQQTPEEASNPFSGIATTPKDTVAQQTPKEAINSFPIFSTPSAEPSSIFSTAKASAPTSTALSMPTLTGTAAATPTETTKRTELPKIPKVHVPKEWDVAIVAEAQGIDGLHKHISELAVQLQVLNERYRQQLSSLPLTADWSSVSMWHCQRAAEIKKKIDNAKKQYAAAKGITGKESALSMKRKVNEESLEDRDDSPSKRARPSAAPMTPPHSSAPTPKFNPPATSTSNMFAKAIGNKPSTPSASSNIMGEKSDSKALNSAASVTGFTPSFSTKDGGKRSNAATTSTGFAPALGDGSKPTSSSLGFQPNLGSGSTGGAGGFFTQFSKTAKTYEELAAERKAKAMAEDYDSDEETKAQWSARYDKKEAERLAAEKKQIAATPTFSIPASTKSSGSTTPSSTPFTGVPKPVTGASTPGLFTTRVSSPTPSTGGQSVFDAPSTAQTPSPNIFGHLPSGPSSNNQDESDEDNSGEQAAEDPQNDKPVGSIERTTPPKRKFGESETESDETLEETMRRKKQETGLRGSLLSRMTRDDDETAESEKENSNSASIFGQTNGMQTSTNKPFHFFDFDAAGSKTGSPKSDTFAGDQTFKPGSPIKFGAAPTTEKNNGAPKFLFQPATPSASNFSTTPAKPPATSLLNFGSSTGGSSLLAPNVGFSGPGSVASSVFSSRAATPLSEADTSAASAAEDDEEGGKQEQVDFAKLTEEELGALDVVFHAEVALAKHAIDKGDRSKIWANIAKGPLWILKDKVTAKCFVRIRIASGATPLNYQILPALQASVTGSSKKQVVATMPKKEGGLNQVYYALKTPEIAAEFAGKYNESLPSK